MDTELARKPFSHRLAAIFSKNSKVEVVEQDKEFDGEKQALGGKLYTHMIRRVDDAPKLVNPSGWISETPREDQQKDVPVPSAYRAPDVQIRSHEADARRKKCVFLSLSLSLLAVSLIIYLPFQASASLVGSRNAQREIWLW